MLDTIVPAVALFPISHYVQPVTTDEVLASSTENTDLYDSTRVGFGDSTIVGLYDLDLERDRVDDCGFLVEFYIGRSW
jgi:hypothetical protein